MSLSDDELRKFWEIANGLRKSLDAAEYKHIVLGLIFLKYVSDAFEDRRSELETSFNDPKSDSYKANEKARANALEVRDYYKEVNVFWVPEKARWSLISASSKQPELALMIDDALYEIEKENPKLEGIVERSYATSKLSVADLGAVVDLIGTIGFGGNRREASDVLGQVYEYFLGKFASAEGKLGGQFYTTPSIVKTIVEILKPTSGRVYDPACGSGGMFVQSERFLEAHGGKLGEISIYGQESNPTTRRLCAMNLAIRGIDFNLGKTHGDTFLENQHKDVRFDYILMNPPFGKSASYPKAQLLDDVRWKKYGIPREKPANYAWMSHAVHHLAPKGRAGVVMPKNTLNSEQGTDLAIRSGLLDDDIVDCIIEMPGNLFFNTSIPCALWFFDKSKPAAVEGKVLFIDATSLGHSISKSQIEYSDQDIERIAKTYALWRSGENVDEAGWASSVDRGTISLKRDSLATSRYVEPLPQEGSLPSQTQFTNAIGLLNLQLSASRKINEGIEKLLVSLGGYSDPKNVSSQFYGSQISVPADKSQSLGSLTGAIFKAMFVDFSISDDDSYLNTLTASLRIEDFYNQGMQTSEFGPIPKGWKIATIGDIAQVVDCLHSKKPPLIQSGLPYIQLKCIGEDGNFDLSQLDFISQSDYTLWTSRIEVREGDCIITNVGRVGAVAQIPIGFKGAIGRNITAIRPNDYSLTQAFLAELLFSDFMKQEIKANTDSGTVLDALNVRSISNLKFILPPDHLLSIFENLVRPIQVLNQSQQSWVTQTLFRNLIEGGRD